MKPAHLLVPMSALLAAPAAAQDCKLCLGDPNLEALVGHEWFAEFHSVATGEEVTARLDFEAAGNRRFAGTLCFGAREDADCTDFSGAVGASGHVEMVVGTGADGFNVELDLDAARRTVSGRLSFRSPGEWFAECFVDTSGD